MHNQMHIVHHSVNPHDASYEFARAMHSAHHSFMNLTRIRQARGLSQRDLAEMIGVNQSTIQRAEQAHPSAKLSTYQACADALGITLEEIFSAERSDIEALIIETFRKIPQAKQEKVLTVLELLQSEEKAAASGNDQTGRQ